MLIQQKKQLRWLFWGALCLVLLMVVLMLYVRRNVLLKRKSTVADEVIEEAISDMEKTEDSPDSPDVELTDREKQILQFISQGKTSPQIAEKMYLSLPTIKWYRKKLLIKFEASNTADLVFKAKEKGLI